MENLTHWKKMFNYEYIGAYSLKPGEERTLTIKETRKEKVKGPDGKEQECFVAIFEEKEKPMILNKTNCKIITKIYDDPHIENWRGLRITVYATKVNGWGEMLEALRVKNEKPGSDPVKEIKVLFSQKKHLLTPEQVAATERIISKKEKNNYNRTLSFLKKIQ